MRFPDPTYAAMPSGMYAYAPRASVEEGGRGRERARVSCCRRGREEEGTKRQRSVGGVGSRGISDQLLDRGGFHYHILKYNHILKTHTLEVVYVFTSGPCRNILI